MQNQRKKEHFGTQNRKEIFFKERNPITEFPLNFVIQHKSFTYSTTFTNYIP